MTVAGRCERRTRSEIIAAQLSGIRNKIPLNAVITKTQRAKAKQREVLEGSVQHTELQFLIKLELYFRGKIGCEVSTN